MSFFPSNVFDPEEAFVAEAAALAVKVTRLENLNARFNIAVRKAQREAAKPRQATVKLPSGATIPVSEGSPEAAEAEVERLLKLFGGATVIWAQPTRQANRR